MSPQVTKLSLLIIILYSILLSGCFDPPEDFVSPSWDVEVNIPVTSKEFSLMDMVEKDSSLLKWYKDPENLGLLYFSDTTKFETIRIEDKLKIDGFNTSFSQTLGTIKIPVPVPSAAEINVATWAPQIIPGTKQVFPEQEGDVEIPFGGLQTIKSIKLDEGSLTIYVLNDLPVDIVLRGVKIKNAIDGSIIAERPNSPSKWLTIPPYKLDSLEFDISGKTILDSLEYVGTIYSPGSNGQEVMVLQDAITQVLAVFNNLVIAEASAPLPVQRLDFTENVKISDSTKIESVVIHQGRINLNINNNMDVALSANVKFDNLFDANGNPYVLDLSLGRNEHNKAIDIPSLQGWKISTLTPGVPTNELSYSISVVTDSTGEISTITKNDSISFNLDFEELVFESFTGLITPTKVNLDNSGFKINYGDISDKIKFSQINFGAADLYLDINSSANFNILINGNVFASNGTTTNTLTLQDIYIPSEEPTKIDLSSLINGFSSDLPDSFAVRGTTLLNPEYQLGSVSMNDSVYGNIHFDIPLYLGIAAGVIKDTLELNLDNVNKDEIDNVNYAEVTFEITNSIPIGLTFVGYVVDDNFIKELRLPPTYNEMDSIRIPKPTVSENGDIIEPGKLTQTLMLKGDDVQKFLNNSKMIIEVRFETAGANNLPVKFRTSNKISFTVKGSASYRAELDGNGGTK